LSKLKEKPSALKKEHPTLQKMRFIYFFHVRADYHFALLDPNLDCESGYGSREAIESGSTALVGGYMVPRAFE
jgi:hypothetical protein